MILPVIRRAQRDGNEPPSVPFHGADERPPGCAGIARLHADRAVQRPQKAVVVRKAARLDRDLPRGDDLGKGRDLQRCARQARKVERRGIVLRRVQTVRVRKMGVPRPSSCARPFMASTKAPTEPLCARASATAASLPECSSRP